jgi:hypothetical protein
MKPGGVTMVNKTYRRINDVVTRVVAGEKLIVPVKNCIDDMLNIFSVDDVGSFIWDRMDGLKSVSTILVEITEEFDVDTETAGRDLVEFIEKLLKSGLIEEV